MKFIPNYRVCYGGRFYEAGDQFPIKADDADRRGNNGQLSEIETPNRRG